MPPALRVAEAARLLGISRSSLFDAIARGACPVRHFKVGDECRLTHLLLRRKKLCARGWKDLGGYVFFMYGPSSLHMSRMIDVHEPETGLIERFAK